MSTAYGLVLIVLASAAICYAIAKYRRADATYWCLMGSFFGPLAIPFAFLSKPEEN